MKTIIAAHAGTGKTYFSSLYPELTIDLVCMPYKYILTNEKPFSESSKANPENILNPDWPNNYISVIKENLESDKILLIPSDSLILDLLKNEKLHYFLCYPQRNAKEIYRERYIKRGNSDEFIDIFIDGWDKFMDRFGKDTYGQHIVLQPEQFLSDVIDISQLMPNAEVNSRQTFFKLFGNSR